MIWLYLGSKRQNRALASARCTFLDDNKVSYLVGKHEIFDLPCKNQGVLSMVSAVLGRHFGQDGLLGALVGFGGVFGAWSLLQQEEQEILDLPCKK